MTLEVVAGLVRNNEGQILITQRSPRGSHPLDWEFPGGKKEKGETLKAALFRELKEEISIECTKVDFFSRHHHSYSAYDVNLTVFWVEAYTGMVRCNENQVDSKWVSVSDLAGFTFPAANKYIIDCLLALNKACASS